jgi:cytoskeletal protein CcmA (bactofilin family)
MKKTKQQEAECPHCHSVQSEPLGAISTNCKSCGRYFKLAPKAEARSNRPTRETREVFCVQCGAPNLVATAALSTQCIRCSHYLELGNKTIRGVYTGKLYAYDDVIFEEGCSFRGMEATGRRMEVRGKVFTKLRATEEIVAMGGCNISGEIHALTVRIERGATVKVQELECARLLVSGAVEITGSLIVTEIVLSDGAVFSGKLQIPEGKLMIDAGASVQFDTITCEELTVAGNVTLTTSLAAERVNVLAGGQLTAPVIRASSVEVSPGGMLQTRIEMYVPLEKPKRPVPVDEPTTIEPEAEAA